MNLDPYFPLWGMPCFYTSPINHIPQYSPIVYHDTQIEPEKKIKVESYSSEEIIFQASKDSQKVITQRNSKPSEKSKRRRSKKKKDAVYGWRTQSKDRNLTSVIMKQYSEMVLFLPQLIKIAQKMEKKQVPHQKDLSFREFIQKNFPASKTYVGLNYMKRLLRETSSEAIYRQTLRRTLKLFLKETYPLTILQNRQLTKQEKLNHLQKLRHLIEEFFLLS